MESGNLTRILAFFVLILAVVCAALAVRYRQDRDELEKQLVQYERALESVKTEYADAFSTVEPADGEEQSGVYDFLGVLAQKDAEIKELEQMLLDGDPGIPPGSAVELREPEFVETAPSRPQLKPPEGSLRPHEIFLNSVEVSQMGPGEYEHHMRLQQAMQELEVLLAAAQRGRTEQE